VQKAEFLFRRRCTKMTPETRILVQTGILNQNSSKRESAEKAARGKEKVPLPIE
jgi:hypothetical protein